MKLDDVIKCYAIVRKPKRTKRAFRRYRATYTWFDIVRAKARAARWAVSIAWE